MEKYKQALHPGTPVRSTENVYIIEKVLGQGSFGITYLASTYMKGNRGKARVLVALKEFFAEDLDVRCGDGAVAPRTMDGIAHKYAKAFQRESENLSKMDHPGIVHVMEAFEANGTYYYSMEYLSGGSLDDKVRGGGMPEADALPLIAKIGDALSYMHGRRMIHLDLKPKNIVLQGDGTPVIIDFGLSKQYDKNGKPESSTSIGGGTPGYAPLEQGTASSGALFRPTLDVYALGATLYKMLTGQTPPEASLLLNNIELLPPELKSKGVSAKTVEAIGKAMSPRMDDRPQTVAEFLKLMGVEEKTKIKEQDISEKPEPKNKRKGLWIALSAIAVCATLFFGPKISRTESADKYFSAANKGKASAQYKLGECYYKGLGVLPDTTEAVKWFRRAAEQGYAEAQYELGRSYYFGEGERLDYKEAVTWLGRAAEQGHASSQNLLAHCYYLGRGVVNQDYEEAAKWYRRAAEQGNVEAQSMLGTCYFNETGVPRDYYEAIKWFRLAADQGEVYAQYNMGLCFDQGFGVDEEDGEEAAKWYRMAADQGYADAQCNLGRLYLIGEDVDEDYDEAVKWFTKAANQGNYRAQLFLGYCYLDGLGVDEDAIEAMTWFRRSAKQGFAEAQFALAERYYYGDGVDQDYAEAVKWFRLAAGQGSADAQHRLGYCHEFGQGVDQDFAEAKNWYEKAKENGDSSVQEDLDRLAKKMR